MLNDISRIISVAPMMDYTDRHYRYLARLLSPNILLYTEMVTAQAIRHGDRHKLLSTSSVESPVALQLGGADPEELATAVKFSAPYGYDEINLNVGCPSNRVQSGRFGVCLMLEPERVAACFTAMRESTALPVTVKTRIGVDENDSYDFLVRFVEVVAASGCKTFILHARKAWLHGLSPKQNRTIPPLDYERVYRLKRDFPHLEIIINGGITESAAVARHLSCVDGVMIGREACRNTAWLYELENSYYSTLSTGLNRQDVLLTYLDYVETQYDSGTSLQKIMKPCLGLLVGIPNAREYRREMCVDARNGLSGISNMRSWLRDIDPTDDMKLG
jgi:tRNA-dihydrouridine synthase A